jgi:L-fuculose-phosphate aldolase
MKSEWLLRREMAAIGRRLYERGLVAATDGNLSARMRGGMLVTPAACCLGELRPQELIYIATDADPASELRRNRPVARFEGGILLSPPTLPTGPRPTSELPMHRAAYAARPDIGAVVHAHPPMATALTLAGLSLTEPVLPEVVLALGAIPTAAYATPSTAETARVVETLFLDHDAILLERHGAVTLGVDLSDAFRKLEKLEQAARIVLAAHSLGEVRPLSAGQIARLDALREDSTRKPATRGRD